MCKLSLKAGPTDLVGAIKKKKKNNNQHSKLANSFNSLRGKTINYMGTVSGPSNQGCP